MAHIPEKWRAVLLGADLTTIFQIGNDEINVTREAGISDAQWKRQFLDALNKVKARVVRQVELNDAEARREMADAIVAGIEAANDHDRCFTPNHGLRAERGGSTLKLHVCFKCSWIWAWGDEEFLQFATTRSAEPLFDRYFPQFKATREAWEHVREVERQISSYQLPIENELRRSRALIAECEAFLGSQDDLEGKEQMLQALQSSQKTLDKRVNLPDNR